MSSIEIALSSIACRETAFASSMMFLLGRLRDACETLDIFSFKNYAFAEYVGIVVFGSSRAIKSSTLNALSGISLFRNLMGISYTGYIVYGIVIGSHCWQFAAGGFVG